MVVVDEEVVYAPGKIVVEARQDLGVVWIGNVQDDQAVTPIRGALAADHCDAAVVGDLHVVDGASVDLNLPDLDDIGRVGDVPKVGVAVGAPSSGYGVVAPVDAFPNP